MTEYTLEEMIENTLSSAYSIHGDMLHDYLLKRYMLINKIKKVKNISLFDFSEFICDLMYLDTSSNSINYCGYNISVKSYFEESIINVISNWSIFVSINAIYHLDSNEKSRISQIENFCSTVIPKGVQKSKHIKGIYKKYFFDKYVLEQLNNSYHISPMFPVLSEHLQPVKPEALSERTYESICDAYISAMLLDSKDNVLVLEKDIELYLYKNYKKYFQNAIRVDKQFDIGSGYIVDMRVECDDCVYIIEIKNKKDDRLYWQSVNYYNVYESKIDKDLKIITIAPEYSSEMLKSLKELKYSIVKKFELKIDNGKIVELSLFDM